MVAGEVEYPFPRESKEIEFCSPWSNLKSNLDELEDVSAFSIRLILGLRNLNLLYSWDSNRCLPCGLRYAF